jgi:hypothetical protein
LRRFFAGAAAFFAARFFVAFFAGGTVTTFQRELSLGEVRTSSGHSAREGVQPAPYSVTTLAPGP